MQIPDVYNTSQEARQKINDHKTPEGVWSAQNGRALATSNHNEEQVISLHSSDLWFQYGKANSCDESTLEYNDTPAYCPDVSLPITGLKKTFWEIFWEIFTETGLSSKETG